MPLREGIDADGVDERTGHHRVWVECPQAHHDVDPAGRDLPELFGSLGRRHTRWHDEVSPALPAVRAHLAGHGDLTLPEVRDASSRRSRREVEHQRACLREVEEVEDVRGGRVGRDDPQAVRVGVVEHEVGRRRTEGVVVHTAPLGVGDDRQRPQVRLDGEEVVELVEDEGNRVPSGELAVPRHLAETSAELRSIHESLLRSVLLPGVSARQT